jgi:hypothetical protein
MLPALVLFRHPFDFVPRARAHTHTHDNRDASSKGPTKDYHATPRKAPSVGTEPTPESRPPAAAAAAAPAAVDDDDDSAVAGGGGDDARIAFVPPAVVAARASEGHEDEDEEEWEEPDADVIMTHADCLFCGERSASLEDNLKHMSIAHGTCACS